MPGRTLLAILVALAGAATGASGQWLNYPSPGTPRTRAGKPNLAARAPRASNGKPDLSGVWQVEATPMPELERLFGDMTTLSVPGDDAHSISKYLINILADFQPSEAPLRPQAVQLLQQHLEHGKDRPTVLCLPAGIPGAELLPLPYKIIQTPGLIVMLFEGDGTVRQVYLDGRKPPAGPEPLWLGYSVGAWDGDTLVVHSSGFNDKSWLDAMGHPHGEALQVTETYRRRDFGHMEVAITIDDRQMYTKPFTIKVTERLQPDSDVLESFCTEDEKDRIH